MDMQNNKSAFKVGDIVVLSVDQSRKGPIIEVLPPVQGKNRYKVFHSPTEIREYLENQVALDSTLKKEIIAQDALKSEEFVARLNSLRLSHPQTDSLYSLHAARIRFIPFQFKPILRFLRSDRPRLLIADEVGVGKTIEAGLILRELQSRHELKNVLILCPKALVQKWKAEMRRFDEDFRPLSAETLKYCLDETQKDGIWPGQYSRSIVHIELLRRADYLKGTQGRKTKPGLYTLEPPPQFDLLIVDEAHHLRTPDSNTHELACFLCEISEAVVFLTATPIQLGSTNLYTLLHLLRPDLFIDETSFNEMILPNRHINQSIGHVRTMMPKDTWQKEAYVDLDDASNTAWGQSALVHDPRFFTWTTRIKEGYALTNEERIKFIRDMEDIHTLAHIMNRTRRRDIGKFTIREPFTISVPFTQEQQKLYDTLISLRKEILSLNYKPCVIALITSTLERQASSCLPALIPALDNLITGGRLTIENVTDASEFEEEETTIPRGIIEKYKELKIIASSLSDRDPKLENLRQIISETVSSEGPGKVLVFSYFLRTLSYLKDNLQQEGFRVALINGQTPDEEREKLRNRFRLDRENKDAIDVLLSSEVGCEGLDYEFCSRLINYDIPWNPMRIEQRIGRIDRFGQKSEKVQIYNFITPGTIEEKIFHKCFERIGIFKDTVGDMEDILGELAEALNQTVLDTSLTPQQAEEKTQQLADNALRLIEEQRRLEEESTELLGLDTAFLQEVTEIQNEGRFVSSEEIKQLIALYAEMRCKGVKISEDTKNKKVIKFHALREDKDVLLEDLRILKRNDRQTMEFERWLKGNEPYIMITFDQDTALEQREIPFITPIHPLTKMAGSYWNKQTSPLYVQLEINNVEIQAGIYVFAYYIWETISFRSINSILPVVLDVKEERLNNDISERLTNLLNQARPTVSSISLSQSQLEALLHKLEEFIQERRSHELEKLRETSYVLTEQRLASINRYYNRRLEKVAEELNSVMDERIRRMKSSQQNRIQREWSVKKQEIEERKKVDIFSQMIAYGILEVKKNAN